MTTRNMHGLRRKLPVGWIRPTCYMLLIVLIESGNAQVQCNESQCPSPPQMNNSRIDANLSVADGCFEDGMVVQYLCNQGFQQLGDGYNATCNRTTGKWEPNGSCQMGRKKAQCVCSSPPLEMFNSRLNANLSTANRCFTDGLEVQYVCNRGFQRLEEGFIAICDETTGEWEPNGECQIDLLTLLIAVVMMIVALLTFAAVISLICMRYKAQHKKAMYNTSADVSEIIDGHKEADDIGVVNIGMTDLPPSPRIIPIEDPYETKNEVATQTTLGDTMVEVHYVEDTIDGYGVIKENGMVPTDPQAGTSTEKLIDTEQDEEDWEAPSFDAYASIDRPIARVKREDSNTVVGGSVKVRPVTAPPSLLDRSSSVRSAGPKDGGGDVEALYAKINRVKRASERWPPGSKDPARPKGRPADLDDLLSHIDKTNKGTSQREQPWDANSPSQPIVGTTGTESLYAEVDLDKPNSQGSISSAINPIPTAPKPARRSIMSPTGSKQIKRYAPPSRVPMGDTNDLYTQVDRSFSNRNTASISFTPPAPPPLNGTDGLYAQIDRDRKSRRDVPPNAGVGNTETSTDEGGGETEISADEGFVDQATARV